MFYPTQRAAFLMGVGFPLTLLLAIISPELWPAGAAWAAFVFGALILDMLLAPAPGQFTPVHKVPGMFYVGSAQDIDFGYDITGGRTPVNCEIKLSANEVLSAAPDTYYSEPQARYLPGAFRIKALRRGEGVLKTLWLRYTGPLGLIWRQRQDTLDINIAIVPDTRLLKDKAIEFFSRDAIHGEKMQIERGEGTEFDSLREFMQGMDKRAIDWKHSARHRKLHAKEFRTERNHNIVFAMDTGYLMCEPISGGERKTSMARLDWAINASLLISYISLKTGDKVGYFGFDERPYLYTKPISGTATFPHLQGLTAQLDYSAKETNFTLGLSSLSKNLRRRSLIIVFTEFVDTINAELMIENITRLIKSHMVIFVAFKDADMESIVKAPPDSPQSVTKSVIAANFLKEREIVLARLHRLGVQIVHTDCASMSTQVLNRFLDLKRREMI